MLLTANRHTANLGGGKSPKKSEDRRSGSRPLVTEGLAGRCGRAARGAGMLAVVGGEGRLCSG